MKNTQRTLTTALVLLSSMLGAGAALAQAAGTAGIADPKFVGGSSDAVTTTGAQSIRDMKAFHALRTNTNDHNNSPISIRERDLIGNGSADPAYAPNINFHWGYRASNSLWMDAGGTLNYGSYSASGSPGARQGLHVGPLRATSVYAAGNLDINNGSPTIQMRDVNHQSAMIHVNDSRFYVLRGCGNNATTWCTHNGRWPFYIELWHNETHFGGTVRAPAYLHNSDARLKENIEPIGLDDARENLARLRPVSYAWKADGKAAMGFIAQDVQEIYPNMVSADSEGMLSVEYTQMIAPMLVVLNEVEQELSLEKEKSARLGQALEALEERLAALEAAAE